MKEKPLICLDCRTEKPAVRVGCPGCMADLIRQQPREDWEMALSGVKHSHGHKVAWQTQRRLGLA